MLGISWLTPPVIDALSITRKCLDAKSNRIVENPQLEYGVWYESKTQEAPAQTRGPAQAETADGPRDLRLSTGGSRG
jgi:hypothetical protein